MSYEVGKKSTIVGVLTWVAVWLGGIGGAEATVPVAEWNDGNGFVELSGYVRSISGVNDLGYGAPLIAEETGLNAGVGRVEWLAVFGRSVELKLHSELLWNVSTSSSSAIGGGADSPLFGIGATRSSEPSLDLKTEILNDNGILLTHEIDRLAVDIYTDVADITVGRQGITWGKSAIFPVADLWARFSPFDLDTEQKPGIDAVRALFYPSMSSEIDVVIADRGSLEDLSGGVRGAVTVDKTDLHFAAGKFWNEIIGVAGVSVVFDRFKLRAEGAFPWNLDDGEAKLPRATGGFEVYGADYAVGTEYHFNGAGAADPSGYTAQLESEVFQRGESYFLGRHYTGVYASYGGVPDLELSLSAIGNLGDPSLIVTPTVRYTLAQNTTIGAGAFVAVGEEPTLGATPAFDSEYGAYGNFYFFEIATYY